MAIDQESDARESRVRQGDRAALAELFSLQRERLRRWVESRLDPRMRGRVSPSDVLQEVYLAAEQRLDHFAGRTGMSFAVWVRLLADQRLVEAHRKHLGAEARDAGREVSIDRDRDGAALGLSPSGANLAARLAGDLTSPSQAAIRHEVRALLDQTIMAMDPIDREILSLRHFDELSNDEVAQLLGLPKGTASKRYVRALTRLRAILEAIPGLLDRPV